MHLSVITATRQRPAFLVHVLQQFQSQVCTGLRCEHLVVSDGPDPQARFLSGRWGARYFELDRPFGHAGAFAKDRGIQAATGEYVAFWDDDNLYAPEALSLLWNAACGADIGVVRTRHRLRKRTGIAILPRRWDGTFRPGDIDTMCVCVRRELAQQECWGDHQPGPGTDIRWLQKLARHAPVIHYVPSVIGMHL